MIHCVQQRFFTDLKFRAQICYGKKANKLIKCWFNDTIMPHEQRKKRNESLMERCVAISFLFETQESVTLATLDVAQAVTPLCLQRPRHCYILESGYAHPGASLEVEHFADIVEWNFALVWASQTSFRGALLSQLASPFDKPNGFGKRQAP